MTRPDRFGLQGDPEIQRARRMAFGSGPFALVLGAALTLPALIDGARAFGWPGQLGSALALLTALFGTWQWQNAPEPNTAARAGSGSPLLWFLGGYLTLRAWTAVDELTGPLTPGVLLWPVLMTAALLAWLLVTARTSLRRRVT